MYVVRFALTRAVTVTTLQVRIGMIGSCVAKLTIDDDSQVRKRANQQQRLRETARYERENRWGGGYLALNAEAGARCRSARNNDCRFGQFGFGLRIASAVARILCLGHVLVAADEI